MEPVLRTLGAQEEEEDVLLLTESAAPRVKDLGAVNWRGLWTLISKETGRFLKIPFQAVFFPLVVTLLFCGVFFVSLDGTLRPAGGISLLAFLVPGFAMMAMAQGAFFNTSCSLVLSRLQGTVADVLMPPLSPLELAMGYTVGGMARGLTVGGVTLAAMWLLAPFDVAQPFFALYFAVMGVLAFSLLGAIVGIWGDTFDDLGAVQNFVVLPATLLSGTFFSIKSLPEQVHFIGTFNPFFYLVDGFRYGFTGYADAPVFSGMAILLILDMGLFNIAYWMFEGSRKLKP